MANHTSNRNPRKNNLVEQKREKSSGGGGAGAGSHVAGPSGAQTTHTPNISKNKTTNDLRSTVVPCVKQTNDHRSTAGIINRPLIKQEKHTQTQTQKKRSATQQIPLPPSYVCLLRRHPFVGLRVKTRHSHTRASAAAADLAEAELSGDTGIDVRPFAPAGRFRCGRRGYSGRCAASVHSGISLLAFSAWSILPCST